MYRTWYSVSSQWPHRSSLDRPKEIQHVKMSCEYLWLEGRTKGGDIKSSLYDDYAARGKSMQHFHGIVKASVFVPMGSTPTFYNEDTWCVLCGNARDSQWYAGNDQDIVVCIDPCISHHTPKSGLRHTWPQVTTRHIGANRRYAYVFPPSVCRTSVAAYAPTLDARCCHRRQEGEVSWKYIYFLFCCLRSHLCLNYLLKSTWKLKVMY